MNDMDESTDMPTEPMPAPQQEEFQISVNFQEKSK